MNILDLSFSVLSETSLGDVGSGKTSMLARYSGILTRGNFIPAVIDNFSAVVTCLNTRVEVEVHDTRGQEDFYDVKRLVFPTTDIFVMCYSCTSLPSLESLQRFYLPEIYQREKGKHEYQKKPFILVGAKLDLARTSQTPISIEDAMGMIGFPFSACYQCSAFDELDNLTNHGSTVKSIFNDAVQIAMRTILEERHKSPKTSCCVVL